MSWVPGKPVIGGNRTNFDVKFAAWEKVLNIDQAGNLTIKATNVTIESSGTVKIKGAATVVIEGAATVELKGAVLKLNQGSKPVARVGDTVTINGPMGIITTGTPTTMA